jgi:hypothetical protein
MCGARLDERHVQSIKRRLARGVTQRALDVLAEEVADPTLGRDDLDMRQT